MKLRMKNKLAILFLLTIGLVFSQCTDKTQQMIEKQVEELNKQCPMQVDALTRLDSMEAISGHGVKYNYTMLFKSNKPIDSVEFKKGIHPSLLYNIQTNDVYRPLRSQKITFYFSYKDEAGKIVGTVAIRPEDYAKDPIKPKTFDISTLGGGEMNEAVRALVDNIKQELPIEVKEQNLTITDCSVNGNILQYTYRLSNETAAKFDTVAFKANTTESAIETLNKTPSIKMVADKGVNIHYLYIDKHNQYLCKIIINPDMLK